MPNRTLTTIYDSFFKLLSEKSFDDITVKELCEKSNVSKSTFYNYFKDIFDCQEKFMFYNVGLVFDVNKTGKSHFDLHGIVANPKPFLEHLLDYIEEHLFYLKRIRASTRFGANMSLFKSIVLEHIRESRKNNTIANNEEYIIIAFLLGGTIEAIFVFIDDYNRADLLTILMHIFSGCSKIANSSLTLDAPGDDSH